MSLLHPLVLHQHKEQLPIAYERVVGVLKNSIIQGKSGSSKFNVFPMEAGLGKSRETVRILKEYCLKPGSRKTLLVKKFSNTGEMDEIVQQLNDAVPGSAIAVKSDNWKKWRERLNEIKRYQVVVITHERYIDLGEAHFYRMYFAAGRYNLIIDEKVDFSVSRFSFTRYRAIQNLFLHHSLDEPLEIVCKPLLNTLDTMESLQNQITVCIPSIDDKVMHEFEQIIEGNLHRISDILVMREFIKDLKLLYGQPCLYHYHAIGVGNLNKKLWGLENNIILDANGALEPLYKLSGDIEVIDLPRLMTHSKSTLCWVDFNSSKNNIKGNSDYLDEITQKIKNCIGAHKKILCIIHKEFEPILEHYLRKLGLSVGIATQYKNEQIAINHFGNLVGSNEYKDFTQCWLLGTPHLRRDDYVFSCSSYLNVSCHEQDLSFTGNRTRRFKNERFETVRKYTLANQLYQAMRRIERNFSPQAEYYVVNSDKDVMEIVIEQLPGIQRGETIRLQAGSNYRELTHAEKFIEYVRTLSPGVYEKKAIREHLDIPENNFYRLKHDIEIRRMIDAGIVEFLRTKIKIIH